MSEYRLSLIERQLEAIKLLLQQILRLMRAPVRIRLDTAHAVKKPQPIPAQKGP
jgi:hypothetical protein